MKKYQKYLILILLLFLSYLNSIFATTIKETLVSGDGYDTILPNTFIIGANKFSGDEILTAGKSATAGAQDVLLYYIQHGTLEGYQEPEINYYLGADIGWFSIDENNEATPITDSETLSNLSSMDIYYVNNIEKKIEVPYNDHIINSGKLPNGVTIDNDNLLVNATMQEFEIETIDGKKVKFQKDEDTSSFIEDTSECYTIENGIITDYSDTCSKNVIIPKKINGETVTGIAENAFRGKGLLSVTFPSTITSIGQNAFSDNDNLSDVTFNGKYDSTDFESNLDEAFDNNTEINYDNDLTRALKALEDEYTIKISSTFDTSTIDMSNVIYNEVFKEINKGKYSYHIEKSELTKYYMIHYYYDNNLNTGECFDHKENSFDIFFSIENDGKYYIYFQKRANNCTRVMTVNKELKINYERINNNENNSVVSNVVNQLERNSNNNEQIITKRSILEDLIDENKLDYIFEPQTAKIVSTEDDEIEGSTTKGTLYLFKDDVLYNGIDNFELKNLSNAYYPKISPDNYENLEDYTDAILNAFTEKTGVTDYSFVFRNEEKRYIERTRGANKTYYIGLFDNKTLEYWSIFKREKIKDSYDTNGYTKTSCFDFDSGYIIGYDGNCGANVKIPNRINNQDVTEIADNAFYGLGITSIQLPNYITRIGNYSLGDNDLKAITIPNSITNIGWGAFYNNKIESLTVPSNVILIEGDAFRKNKIATLNLPNDIQEIGPNAFSDNQLSDEFAFIYARKYDETLGKYVKDTTKITSYAGRNRENITIPNNVKIIGASAFQDLQIKRITLPNTLEEIESYAFANNELTEISIPSAVKVINPLAFYSNSDLANVTLNEGTEAIWEYAFYGTSLKEISLPNSIKIIKELSLGNKIEKINVYGKQSIGEFEEIYEPYINKIDWK